MKTIFLPLFIFCISLAAHAQTDFSGTWNIDVSKSDYGNQSQNAMFKILAVKQTKDSLITEGTRFVTQVNELLVVSRYATNGNAAEAVLSNNRTMSAKLEWDAAGKKLTRHSTYSLPGNDAVVDYRSEETWELSGDSKQLLIERIIYFHNGTQTVLKVVYEKQ
jgi:hypothetical protein